jgi:hypothetical protein
MPHTVSCFVPRQISGPAVWSTMLGSYRYKQKIGFWSEKCDSDTTQLSHICWCGLGEKKCLNQVKMGLVPIWKYWGEEPDWLKSSGGPRSCESQGAQGGEGVGKMRLLCATRPWRSLIRSHSSSDKD